MNSTYLYSEHSVQFNMILFMTGKLCSLGSSLEKNELPDYYKYILYYILSEPARAEYIYHLFNY